MVGTVGMIVAGCGGSSPKPVATVPVSTLSRAAYVSSRASGYRAVMRITETIGSTQISLRGLGSFSPASHSGSMTMTMALPGAAGAALGSNAQIKSVYRGTHFYVQLPAALMSRIPGGKPWLSFSIAALGRAAGVPGLGSLMSSSSSFNDPGQYLDYLRAAGSVESLGHATLGGVQTTHYRADVQLSKLPGAVPADARSAVEQLITRLHSFSHGTIPVDVWIDGAHRVRRIGLDYKLTEPTTGQSATLAMTMDFVSYGPQKPPAIPPASQTTSLASLVHVSTF